MRYSPTTKNFYPETINYPSLPDDLVEASWEEYTALHPLPAGKQIGFSGGHLIHEDLPPRPIEELITQISRQRDQLLRDSDWTQLADAPEKDNADWKAYRQALRNLTNNITDPSAVIWPVRPASS